jgi:hypothetical protein
VPKYKLCDNLPMKCSVKVWISFGRLLKNIVP